MRTMLPVVAVLLVACAGTGEKWLADVKHADRRVALAYPVPKRSRDLERALTTILHDSEYVSERKVTAASFPMKFGPLTVLRCPVDEALAQYGENTGELPGLLLSLRDPDGESFTMLLVSQGGEWRLDPSYPLTKPIRMAPPEVHAVPAATLAALHEGMPDETFQSRIGGFWLVKIDGKPYALRTVCPKMGGAPNWIDDAHVYACPICGSKFDWNGERMSGPAPAGLPRVAVSVDQTGQGEVDFRNP